MLLDVTNVEIEQDNKLLLEFENGAKRRFDMTPYLEKKPFDRLKDNHLFQRIHISLGTLGGREISISILKRCGNIPSL